MLEMELSLDFFCGELVKAYPQALHPLENSLWVPVCPHFGQRTEAKKCPHFGQTIAF